MVNTMIMMLATVGLGGPVTCGCGAGVHAERPEAVRSTAGSLDLDLGVGLGLGDPTLVVAPAPLPADVHLLESPDGPRTLSIVTADGTLELDLRAESVRTPRLEAAAAAAAAARADGGSLGRVPTLPRTFVGVPIDGPGGRFAVTRTPGGIHVVGAFDDGRSVVVRPGDQGEHQAAMALLPEGSVTGPCPNWTPPVLAPVPLELVIAIVYESGFKSLYGGDAAALEAEIDRLVHETNVIFGRDPNVRLLIGGIFQRDLSSTATRSDVFLCEAASELHADPAIDLPGIEDLAATHILTTRLWSGQPSTRGVAHIGRMFDIDPQSTAGDCLEPSGEGAYSVSSRVTESCGEQSAGVRTFFFAHELFHVWGATHDNSIPENLMFPALSSACLVANSCYFHVSQTSAGSLPKMWPRKKIGLDGGFFQNADVLADYDKDGVVGFSDFLILNASLGSSDPMFDLDGDWETDPACDVDDLVAMSRRFG